MKKLSLLFLAAATGLALTACAQTTNASPALAPAKGAVPSTDAAPFERNTICVTSTEEVKVTPDIAQIVYAIQTEGPDPAACQDSNTKAVAKVSALFKDFGIEEKSVQTTGYYMNPLYNYSSQKQIITGYEVRTSLTVSGIAIDKVGDLLAQSVKAGVNNIESISYQSSNYDASYQEALKLALEAARAKAETLAAAAGCSIGSVASIAEHGDIGDFRFSDNALASKATAGAMEDMLSLSVMPGEVGIKAGVTVEYFIQ